MITLNGDYTDEPKLEGTYEYAGRVLYAHPHDHKKGFINGICEPVDVKHGDVLLLLGNGTWFAHYKKVEPNK